MATADPVLIVDDDAEIRKVLAIELEDAGGYHCAAAADCRQALALLQGGLSPQAILLDLMMPGDPNAGLDLLVELKANPAWAPIAVVVLSARAQAEVILEALRRGAIDYLVKPYDPDELLHRVQRACQLRGAPPAQAAAEAPPAQRWRALHAEVMRLSLLCWEMTTRQNKVDLAEKSGFWRTYVDAKGTYRTKTLDRYLHPHTLPKRPNTTQVIQTAQFVLTYCPPEDPLGPQLKTSLEQLLAFKGANPH